MVRFGGGIVKEKVKVVGCWLLRKETKGKGRRRRRRRRREERKCCVVLNGSYKRIRVCVLCFYSNAVL
jgi:hypothetical protein